MASLDLGHSLCDQCMISVLPDDLQRCICPSWVHKQCLFIDNDNVNNISDAISFKCENCIQLSLSMRLMMIFFHLHSKRIIHYLLNESRM